MLRTLAMALASAAFAAVLAPAQAGRADVGTFPERTREPRGARLALVAAHAGEASPDAVIDGSRASARALALAESLSRAGFTVRLLARSARPLAADDVAREVEHLARQSGRGDLVLFAYVGPGRLEARGPRLALANDGLALAEVARRLAERATKVVLHAEIAWEGDPSRAESAWTHAPSERLDVCLVSWGRGAPGAAIHTRLDGQWQGGIGGEADRNGDGVVSFREQAYHLAGSLRAWSYEHAAGVVVDLSFDPDPAHDVPIARPGAAATGTIVVVSSPPPGVTPEVPVVESVAGSGPPIRRVTRRNPSNPTAPAIAAGLQWLRAHQDEDGRWDADEFTNHCPGEPCAGHGGSLHDVGLTGLALLAFLGDGHHGRQPSEHAVAVRRAVEWLVAQQRRDGADDGLIGGRASHGFVYDHAIATQALCEAYLLSEDPALREPAQRAVNFVLRARNPYKAWRYAVPPDGENDSSVTGWMVFALSAARDAGLAVDPQAFRGALALFDELTDPETGRCGYLARGEFPARPAGASERFPPDVSESLTAIALLARLWLAEDGRVEPLVTAHADLLLHTLPRWSADGSTNDFYYWYYGSYAMYQMGGPYWKRWSDALRAALLAHQVPQGEGHGSGSWSAVSPWGEEGGRVYATALAVLSLESANRHERLRER